MMPKHGRILRPLSHFLIPYIMFVYEGRFENHSERRIVHWTDKWGLKEGSPNHGCQNQPTTHEEAAATGA